MNPILCLDFDGVCHSYTSGWKGADVIPDPAVEGLFPFLMEAVGPFQVHIFSSRTHQEGGVEAMKKWFQDEFDIWKSCQDVSGLEIYNICESLHFPDHKPSAKVSIDDRAITFKGFWPVVGDLLEFKPWNK